MSIHHRFVTVPGAPQSVTHTSDSSSKSSKHMEHCVVPRNLSKRTLEVPNTDIRSGGYATFAYIVRFKSINSMAIT